MINSTKNGDVFYIELSNNFVYKVKIGSEMYDILLSKGEFIVKFGNNDKNTIGLLELASQLNLIPKIYHIDQKIQISKFIDAVDLDKFYRIYLNKKKLTPENIKHLIYKIIDELHRWHVNGIFHGDLDLRNILMDRKGKIYFIDPLVRIDGKLWDDEGLKDVILQLNELSE